MTTDKILIVDDEVHSFVLRDITSGALIVDKVAKRCLVDGQEVKLRRKEFEILVLLLEHRQRIFSREEILAKVWPNEVVVLDRVVDVNITRLRQTIGRYGKLIITRSGYGYGFMDS
jgi:two-component system phosphate regulon response regulator PhoB